MAQAFLPVPLSHYNRSVTRRRFLADTIHSDTAILTGQNAEHLSRVLRARPGQEFEISGEGHVWIAKITAVESGRVEFALGEEVAAVAMAPVTLLLAIFKFDRFEWAVEKATELGVAEIVPVIASRTDAHLAQAAAKRSDRWRRIAHEAAQQSRRTSPPEIAEPVKLKEAIAAKPCSTDALVRAPSFNVVLSEGETERSLRDALEHVRTGSIALAVGPEGGWTDDELQLFAKHEWISASLGPTILRAETAAVAGLAVVASVVG